MDPERTAEWVTREEAARRLKCSVDTIDRHVAAGRLKRYTFGRLTRFKAEDVDRLVTGPDAQRDPET
ncbi:MAG TPA: helix-turn-helix domain-containing protein [Nocardioides sp.]|nr:helix-turn-helix domain-containing protein [Nocardioides sp.]